MRGILAKLFTQSPFGQLNEHMKKVQECCNLIEPMFEALRNQDRERLSALAKDAYRLEHEADIIKGEIRDRLPRSILLPVNRADVLSYLKEQDGISDMVEDVAVLLNIRPLEIPEAMREPLAKHTGLVLRACREAGEISGEIASLVDAGFSGPEAEKVLDRIKNLGQLEWEADKAQQRLTEILFSIEQELDPVSVVMWMKIITTLDNLADYSENTGDMLRVMLARG
jgi:predicted phosphate transport protein (TIGR00153 family)